MLVVGIAMLVLPAATATAAAAVNSDPSSGSPSGVIYRLPVDTGRQDAAPHGDSGSGSGGSPAVSTYRSDNNFGTSSIVPGAPRGEGKGGAEDGKGGEAAGGSGEVAGGAVSFADTGAVADTGDTSEPLGIAMLLAIVGVGALLGIIASRSRARATG